MNTASWQRLALAAILLLSICPVHSGAADAPSPASTSTGDLLHFRARRRVSDSPNSPDSVIERDLNWDPKKTAIVVCDMWNQHWCQGATRRVAEMAPRMNQVLNAARQKGVFIIHCPSDTMKYYQDWPQRKLAQSAPHVTPKVPLQNWCNLDRAKEAPLPVDDSDGGCDDWPQCRGGSPWTHQIDTLQIKPGDAITDSAEAYYLMQQRGIDNVIVMGVHANMCVLGRPFSIRQMVAQGKNVVLMRDLTDSMYNSRRSPFVSHFRGTELIVEHIEKYWCPSVTSVAFLGGEPFHFQQDVRPNIAFLISEPEYHTGETLPEFARSELESRGYHFTIIEADPKDPNHFPHIDALRSADLVVISARRRTLPTAQLQLLRDFIQSGKPVVGIRTASHAFDARPDSQHAAWTNFDREILGAHYLGHYNNVPPNAPRTEIRIIPAAANHAICTGLPGHFSVTSHLYKNRDLADTVEPLLDGHVEGQTQHEPVAWINTADHRRVFYTSLGSPDDFKLPAFRRLLLNGILWALDKPIPPASPSEKKQQAAAGISPIENGVAASASRPPASLPSAAASQAQKNPLSPAESLQRFEVASDFQLDQVLAEPAVRQPVFINFDERGRMWVVQYIQYPDPAGLKMVSRDEFWRAVYDKVPPPPPHHFPGKDKITIFEDTDGDGIYDKETTFVDGLNIATAVVKGRGGVWVLNPPYLLFYPDQNNDDIPDGDPQVVLSGFGLEDTHSVVNSLRWGPDGWLYAAQGSTVTAKITRPGIDQNPILSMGQLIWRYQPESKRYEIFAEGGGNAFGVELDSQGRIFSGHNGGNTRGFHYVQGGYLQKGFNKHGPLSNPYAFGYFPPMRHPDAERFTHTFLIYDSGALPARHWGKLFGCEPLQGRIVESDISPDGSTFQTADIGFPVVTSDKWFRPVDIKLGPDGAIYIADWYDQQVNHYRNHEGQMDASNGRIYRLKAKGAPPIKPFDLDRLSSSQLVDLLAHTNRWFRQTALRLIGDRKDPSIIPQLKKILREQQGQIALEALWAIHLCGGLTDDVALATLSHPNPHVREWTARLLCDENKVSDPIQQALVRLAQSETAVETRAQLACSAKRLPAAQAFPIVRQLLAHSEDSEDPRIPLLLWWAIEAKAQTHPNDVLSLFSDRNLWSLPLVRNHILERLMQRYASTGVRHDLLICADLLNQSPGALETAQLIAGFEKAFQGRSLANLPGPLTDALAKHGAASLPLKIRQGDPNAIDEGLAKLQNSRTPAAQRLSLAALFGEIKVPKALPALLQILQQSSGTELRHTVLSSLAIYDQPEVASTVIGLFAKLPNDLQSPAAHLLSSRPAWSLQLLQAIDQKQIPLACVTPEILERLKLHHQPAIDQLVAKNWSRTRKPTTAEMERQIAQFTHTIRSGSGNPYDGKKLFGLTCAVCHRLFDQGGQIGPDLTAYKRDDLDTLLLNIVNPNAEIREGFENFLLTTKDGRALNGFLADKDNQVVVLRGLDGQNVVVEKEQIAELRPAGTSLMPEGLLDSLTPQQLRDLFAYLRSSQPLNN